MSRSIKILLAALGLALAALAIAPVLRDTEELPLDDEARARAPGDFVALSHGMTHYQLAGPDSGQVVVLVHGFSVPFYIWDPTFDALADEGFRVLRYDLYGRGFSDRPRVDYTPELFDTQLEELIDALGLATPVDLAGLSMGGPVVARFAAENPDRTRKVVLVDPAVGHGDPGRLGTPLLGEWLAAVDFVPDLPEGQRSDFYEPSRFPGWADRYREQMRYHGFRYAILSTVRNFFTRDPMPHYEALAEREIPVLLVWGEEDTTIPVGNSRALRDILDPTFLLIRQAGHIPHYERPGVVNPGIIAFLRR